MLPFRLPRLLLLPLHRCATGFPHQANLPSRHWMACACWLQVHVSNHLCLTHCDYHVRRPVAPAALEETAAFCKDRFHFQQCTVRHTLLKLARPTRHEQQSRPSGAVPINAGTPGRCGCKSSPGTRRMRACRPCRRCGTASWQPASWPRVRHSAAFAHRSACRFEPWSRPELRSVHCMTIWSTREQLVLCSVRADGCQWSAARAHGPHEDCMASYGRGAPASCVEVSGRCLCPCKL